MSDPRDAGVAERQAAGPAEHDAGAVCPTCGARGLDVFYGQPSVPLQSILLLDDAETARTFPTGELRLALCGGCGFITNTRADFEAQEFSGRYEETQGFSPRFRQFATDLAARLADRYGLEGKRVLEIGCGKGEFLQLMCEVGGCSGIGFDPVYVPGRLQGAALERIEFVQDFYGRRYADVRADMVVCRHTLEHIPETGAFLRTVREAVGDNPSTIVVFEVPDVLRVLREVAFWDIFHEHCSYFTAGSLATLFRLTGFEILDLYLEYDGQYLLIEARPSVDGATGPSLPLETPTDEVRQAVEGFREGFARSVAQWRGRLSSVVREGGRVVVWGSGSKSVGFLTTLGVDDLVEAVVDINPIRQGTFVAGTGHEIVAPERLKEIRPSLVVAMNPIYCDEIRADLNRLDVEAEVMGL